MRARILNDLLKKGDRVAVSNITGREARRVSEISQFFCGNIVGGWALGKGGKEIEVEQHPSIPVFADYQQLLEKLPKNKYPNKIIIYSPPEAVYGEVKNVIEHPESSAVKTIFIITENVAVEVAAKIRHLCNKSNIDVLGCNTLGVINGLDQVRVGAVGGDQPAETFQPGGAVIISNSGNMVNTMASYLYGAGIGVRFGISTGKDQLILTPLKEFIQLAAKDQETSLIVLYVEPGGLYEVEAIEWMKKHDFQIPVIVYVGGIIADNLNLSLGHAGAVVEGKGTSATDKIKLFDDYFGIGPYKDKASFKNGDEPVKGIRIETLHDLPAAARNLYDALKRDRDFRHYRPLRLNPWLKNMGNLGKKLPSFLVLPEGKPPGPYAKQFDDYHKTQFGKVATRRNMRNASHASSNDGATPRVYGRSLIKLMDSSFSNALILSWTGFPPTQDFESKLVEMTLIASFTNGPGTISAQAAKSSASAGNNPNTALIGTLASMGTIHGGNGAKAVEFLINSFRDSDLVDPYDKNFAAKLPAMAEQHALKILRQKKVAKEADIDFERIPCLGHPVYRDKEVNYDPRERVVYNYLQEHKIYQVFLDYYHLLAKASRDAGVTRRILAVNVDAAIACVWLGICWPLLIDKKITVERAKDIPFLAFAVGRTVGGAAEYLDHSDCGQPMDMRVPVSECEALSRPQD